LRKGIELEERDFFKERFSEEELRQLIGSRSPSDFLSWNSPSFRKLGLRREELTDDQLIGMMLDEPRLIRRPLIQVGEELIVGTDREAMGGIFQ
jgi:arsenate reductase